MLTVPVVPSVSRNPFEDSARTELRDVMPRKTGCKSLRQTETNWNSERCCTAGAVIPLRCEQYMLLVTSQLVVQWSASRPRTKHESAKSNKVGFVVMKKTKTHGRRKIDWNAVFTIPFSFIFVLGFFGVTKKATQCSPHTIPWYGMTTRFLSAQQKMGVVEKERRGRGPQK